MKPRGGNLQSCTGVSQYTNRAYDNFLGEIQKTIFQWAREKKITIDEYICCRRPYCVEATKKRGVVECTYTCITYIHNIKAARTERTTCDCHVRGRTTSTSLLPCIILRLKMLRLYRRPVSISIALRRQYYLFRTFCSILDHWNHIVYEWNRAERKYTGAPLERESIEIRVMPWTLKNQFRVGFNNISFS